MNVFDDMLAEARDCFLRADYRAAEPILQQMLLQNQKNPEIYQMLATIAYDQGKFNKAIQQFKRALEIDPTYTDASVGLSIILNDLGRYDEGKQVFQEARSRLDRNKGKDPWLDEKLAAKHEELADLYFQYQRLNEALEQMLKAKSLSQRKAEIGVRIADIHLRMKDSVRAITELKQVVAAYPQMLPARLKLGEALYESKKFSEAVEQFQNVLYQDSQNNEAKKWLQKVQGTNNNSWNAPQAKEW